MGNLIDDLYLHMKAKYIFCKNRTFILDLVFPFFDSYSKNGIQLFRSENYNKDKNNNFREYGMSYIIDENNVHPLMDGRSWKTIRKEKISEFIKNCHKYQYLDDLKKQIIILLEETTIHDKLLCMKLKHMVNQLQTVSQLSEVSDWQINRDWTKVLYYYFYFAITDKLHSDIAFSAYPELEEDLDEYNKKVTMMYGVSGAPGMYQLYALANREKPNIIALYECGELEYYGKGPSGKVNHEKAYEYYTKTRECNKEHHLATWSIAYMKFHYTQEMSEKEEYRVQAFEDELQDGKKTNSWYDSIIENVQISYRYGCSAAANLIGKILDSSAEKFPIEKRRVFRVKSSKQYYKESADAGYVFGCNNYAVACMKEAEQEEMNEKKVLLMKEAVLYMEKAARFGNPWASNRYGLFCIQGLTVGSTVIKGKDEKEAYERFKYALGMTYTDKYYWPLINLCKYFWLNRASDKFLEESIKNISRYVRGALADVTDQNQIKELLDCIIIIEKEMRDN